MEPLKDLRIWIESLSTAEKRFINILGNARAGRKGSQHLELFDWIQKSDKGATPRKLTISKNLPTLIQRLKQLILDSLQIMKQGINIDRQLHIAIGEVIILIEKQLYSAALKKIKRAKKTAIETSRYLQAIQLNNYELQILQVQKASLTQLNQLYATAEQLNRQHLELQMLRHRHDTLQTHVRQLFAPRTKADDAAIKQLCEGDLIVRFSKGGPYLENALATNILGIKNLLAHKPIVALKLYANLLQEWQFNPEWQLDQEKLLLMICKYYQGACFYGPLDWEASQRYLKLLPDFEAFPSKSKRGFQKMLYHNQFTLALNTGKFESAIKLIVEINQWIQKEATDLKANEVLPFLHNFAVAQFLADDFAAANHFVQRILNFPHRKIREDIRDFALVLQAVLQYEMGDASLNEYLTRAGKRRFKKNAYELEFELLVFQFLEKAIREPERSKFQLLAEQFAQEIAKLSAQRQQTVPLLGLMEISLWAQSKLDNCSLNEVFLKAVQSNLDALK